MTHWLTKEEQTDCAWDEHINGPWGEERDWYERVKNIPPHTPSEDEMWAEHDAHYRCPDCNEGTVAATEPVDGVWYDRWCPKCWKGFIAPWRRGRVK